LNVSQTLTQNRVQDALPRLPEDVQRLGVQVRKATPSILLGVHIYSRDRSRDTLYLSNYTTLHIKDTLARLQGVGDVQFQGAREYAMRIWLDPDKVAENNLDGSEVLAALRAQNLQVSAGILNQPPVSGKQCLSDQRRNSRQAVHTRTVRQHRSEGGPPGKGHAYR
jgi:multidrug efflux pump subunit AcrB